MPTSRSDDKVKALRHNGTLNPKASDVRDELFREHEFFDAHDIVQVKYEMLRRVEQEGWSISRSADEFGFSRPTFYQAKEAFRRDGLWGLVPLRRGPRAPHKLTADIVAYLDERLADEPSLTWLELTEEVEHRFGLSVHPRTLKRHLTRRQKKR